MYHLPSGTCHLESSTSCFLFRGSTTFTSELTHDPSRRRSPSQVPIEALGIALERGWVRPILVGPEAGIRAAARALSVELDGMRILHAEADEVAPAAVAEVRAGRARALMKGQIATPSLMKAVLDASYGLRTGRVICQVVLMEIPRDHRRFLMADTGITVQPSLEDKADILRSSVNVAHALGIALPRVALVAATETVKAAMPETVDAHELTRRHEQGEFASCLIQGPLSFDLAYAQNAGDKKHIGGTLWEQPTSWSFPTCSRPTSPSRRSCTLRTAGSAACLAAPRLPSFSCPAQIAPRRASIPWP